MTAAARILERLDGTRQTGNDRWTARCPAHNDRSPSLSIRSIDDRVLIHCFTGCEALDIVHAIGLDLSDLYDCPLTTERMRPTTVGVPATDRLAIIGHESMVVSFIAADFLESRSLNEEAYERLSLAVSRIGHVIDYGGRA